MTRSDQDLFGHVRSVLHMPPGAMAWARLCTLLDGAREPALSEQLIPYALEHLRAWPDELRRLPRHWCRRLDMGQDIPQLAMVRHIDISGTYSSVHVLDALHRAIERGTCHPTHVKLHAPRDISHSLTLLRALAHLPLRELAAPGLTQLAPEPMPIEEFMNLSELRMIAFHDGIDDVRDQLDVLMSAQHMPALESLGLRITPMNATQSMWASHLHRAPLRTRLRRLEIGANMDAPVYEWPPIWEALTTHGTFFNEPWPHLHTLVLRDVEIPALLSSGSLRAKLPALHTLKLESCPIDLEGLRGLLNVFEGSPITRLDLHDCDMSERAIGLIASDDALRLRLEHLSISSTVGHFNVKHLHNVFGGVRWPALRTLNLGFSEIHCAQSDSMEMSDGTSMFPALQKLVLGGARLSESAYYALVRSALPALRTLYCANMEILCHLDAQRSHGRTLRQLTTAPWFEQLAQLELPKLVWNSDMFTHIAGLELPCLRELHGAPDLILHLKEMHSAVWLKRLDVLKPEISKPPWYDGRIAPHYHELLNQA